MALQQQQLLAKPPALAGTISPAGLKTSPPDSSVLQQATPIASAGNNLENTGPTASDAIVIPDSDEKPRAKTTTIPPPLSNRTAEDAIVTPGNGEQHKAKNGIPLPLPSRIAEVDIIIPDVDEKPKAKTCIPLPPPFFAQLAEPVDAAGIFIYGAVVNVKKAGVLTTGWVVGKTTKIYKVEFPDKAIRIFRNVVLVESANDVHM